MVGNWRWAFGFGVEVEYRWTKRGVLAGRPFGLICDVWIYNVGMVTNSFISIRSRVPLLILLLFAVLYRPSFIYST